MPNNKPTQPKTPWKFVPEKLYQGSRVAGRSPKVVAGHKDIAKVYEESNARLIAAAPELYGLLNEAVNRWGNDSDCKSPECAEWLQTARAALAKARGEQVPE